MNHSRTISWDPYIADSRTISVYYDCLCLMALFRTVMYLAHYWAVRIVCVANALFSCHEGVGYCIFHLDHSVLVQSDICHLRCHRDMWVYVWRAC